MENFFFFLRTRGWIYRTHFNFMGELMLTIVPPLASLVTCNLNHNAVKLKDGLQTLKCVYWT